MLLESEGQTAFKGEHQAVSVSLRSCMAGLVDPAPCIANDKPFQNTASNLMAASLARGHALA